MRGFSHRLPSPLTRALPLSFFTRMVRLLAQFLTRLRSLAFRRLVAACVVLAMVSVPLVGAFAVHHANDLDVPALSLSQGISDPTKVVSDQGSHLLEIADTKSPSNHPQAVADHDCHGCAAAVVPEPPSHGVSEIIVAHSDGPVLFGYGRFVSTDLRPPRV